MEVIEVGIDCRMVRSDLLDRCAIPPERQPELLREIRSGEVPEAFVLATCQRTELYCASLVPEKATAVLGDRFRHMTAYDSSEIPLITRRGGEAVRHIVAVAAGLESALLGEHEILGQVRRAYLTAQEAGAIGPILGHLARHAIACGRNIRNTLGIGNAKRSLTEMATAWVRASITNPERCTVAVVGAGETAYEMLERLSSIGIRHFFVFSRQPEHARSVALRFQGQWGGLDDLIAQLQHFEVIVCAMALPAPVLTVADLQKAAERTPDAAFFIVDLGMPRNVELTVSALPYVHVLDLPTVLSLAVAKSEQRTEWVERARSLIDKSVEDFRVWQRVRVLAPVLEELRSHYEETILREASGMHPGAPPAGRADDELKRFAQRLAGRLLHPLFSGLKEIVALDSLQKPEEVARCLLPAEWLRERSSDASGGPRA